MKHTVRIDPKGEYPPDSLGAEVLRLCAEANAALPGAGVLMLAKWNRDCLCPQGNEAPAGGDCIHPTCPRDEQGAAVQ